VVERGYEVIGVMLRLWSESPDGTTNRCCTLDAMGDARRVARKLGIPLYPLSCARRFKRYVVDEFIGEYARGRTPNPCLACNRYIKFGFLLQIALSLDAEVLATGHYARVQQEHGHYQLLRGLDERKDQSYVLYMLSQQQLSHVAFPIGEYTKSKVRDMAARRDLPVADKADSQDICFVHDGDYRRFLRERAPQTICPGPIYDAAGREIGQHDGLPLYTIGQRRGLGIAHSEPLYVLEIDPAHNALVVGPSSQPGERRVRVGQVSFVNGQPPSVPTAITAKIRYTGREVEAVLFPARDRSVDLLLSTSLRDITPGQAAVFYRRDTVLGGGIIEQNRIGRLERY
jgi:tRNA-specific 2-thiouridylase